MAMDPRLERAYRNRMSLPPDQRAAVEQAYAAALAQSEAQWYGQEPANVESDLDAAATPMPAEPALQPRRKRSRADAAVDSAMAGELYSPSEIVGGMRAADMPAPVAAPPAMPDADPRTTRAERLAQFEEWSDKVDRQAATYNRDTGLSTLNEGYVDEEGPYPGAGRPGYDRTFTPAELLAQQELAEAERQTQLAEQRNAAIGAKYGPQARKIAEAAGARGEIDFSAVQSPREKEMNQYREAIERSARFDPDTEQRESSRELRGALERSRSEDRKKFRAQVAAAPKAPADPRMERWKAQAMLAGGQPTGGPRGTKAATNALMSLPQEWQNLVLAKGLRPDIDGTTPLTADAAGAKNAMRFVTADMLGQGMLGDTREAVMRQKSRDDAVARANELAQKYVGWDGQIDQSDAEVIRRRVEAQYPGMGDAAYNSLPIRQSRPAAPATPPNPTGGAI